MPRPMAFKSIGLAMPPNITPSFIRSWRATASRISSSRSRCSPKSAISILTWRRHGIEVTDTDLGERIVQLRKEPPSHIVMPAIHMKREEIGELFHIELGTEKGASDPKYLTEAARGHLRRSSWAPQAGLTGVNFAVAETGGVVVCTNEGNADLGATLPRLHIACMGIEKLIPRAADLSVFLRLLARSGTGQPITDVHLALPRAVRGGEMHVVIVDNGRSRILGRTLSAVRSAAFAAVLA